MTVSSQAVTETFTATGAATFALQKGADPITYRESEAITVTVDGAEVTDFTVTPYSSGTTAGALIFGAASIPASGAEVIVTRKTPRTQPLDLRRGGTWDAEDIEREFDRHVLMIQELAESIESGLGDLVGATVAELIADGTLYTTIYNQLIGDTNFITALANQVATASVDWTTTGF